MWPSPSLLAFLLCLDVAVSKVSWFLHVSDLHYQGSGGDRVADLDILFREYLADFRFSAVLLTGDLVEGKSGRRSEQHVQEWQDYDRTVRGATEALGLETSSVYDIRGNHDVFDAGQREGDRDYFRQYGAQGTAWSKRRVLISPIFDRGACPIYVLVGVDLTPEMGLRSPTNFFGVMTEAISTELERGLVQDMRERFSQQCEPPYLAYGHFPLSTAAQELHYFGGAEVMLAEVLLKYGVRTWFCGHLHDALGDDLFRLHSGDAATLLELETTDWKFKRRFRIVALDNGHLSYLDLEMQPNSRPPRIQPLEASVRLDEAVVLITSPPRPYLAPLGNGREPTVTSKIRALVWPTNNGTKMEVNASIWCGQTQQATHVLGMEAQDNGHLYEVDVGQSSVTALCQQGPVHIQVGVSTAQRSQVALSALQEVQEREFPADYSHSWLERLALSCSWSAVFQNALTTLLLCHVLLLMGLPLLAHVLRLRSSPSSPSLDTSTNGVSPWRRKLLGVLFSPIRGCMQASQFRLFWIWQIVFALMLLFGPWNVARVLSDQPLAILFHSQIYLRQSGSDPQMIFSPEMPFRSSLYYCLVVLPTTLWMLWTLSRWMAKVNGSPKRRCLMLLFHTLLGLYCLMGLIYSATFACLYYGPGVFFLSPVYLPWVLLNAVCFYMTARRIPKCRQE